jgi:hypothetical protein
VNRDLNIQYNIGVDVQYLKWLERTVLTVVWTYGIQSGLNVQYLKYFERTVFKVVWAYSIDSGFNMQY